MWITAIIITVLLFADQFTKYLTEVNLTENKVVNLVPNLLSVTKVYNKGAAWGMGDGATWLLALISIVGMFVLMYFLTRCNWKKYKFYSIVVCLLFAGCTGNMIDRVASLIPNSGRPAVVDMVKLPFGDAIWNAIFHTDFPVWNIADACLVIGVILMMIYVLFRYEKDKARGLLIWK